METLTSKEKAQLLPMRSLNTKSVDSVTDIFCKPCYEADGQILDCVGFCHDCSDWLCKLCFTHHKRARPFRHHRLDDFTEPQDDQKFYSIMEPQPTANEICHKHQGELIQTFCWSCDQLCCKICITIEHPGCNVEKLSTISLNFKATQQLEEFHNKLSNLKLGFALHKCNAGKHMSSIEIVSKKTLNDIGHLRQEFNKLLDETEKQAKEVEEEDMQKMKSVINTCEDFTKEINKIETNVSLTQLNTDHIAIFISIKRATNKIQICEACLKRLETENKVKHYKFDPEKKLKAMLTELKQLNHSNDLNLQPLKTPVHFKDIDITTSAKESIQVRGCVILQNQQLLLLDYNFRAQLLDIQLNKIVAELQIPGHTAWDVTKVTENEVAVACHASQKIQFLTLTSDTIVKGREISVSGTCSGIVYNDQDKTFVVSFISPGKVEIIDLNGPVIKRFERYVQGAKLFARPEYVGLSLDKTLIYVSDCSHNSVTALTLNGEVKAIYKDRRLKSPTGICGNRIGVVYVVGSDSNTVHQILPGSDKLEPLLDQKDGLNFPWTITYSNVEDKIYIGQGNVVKVFQMK